MSKVRQKIAAGSAIIVNIGNLNSGVTGSARHVTHPTNITNINDANGYI